MLIGNKYNVGNTLGSMGRVSESTVKSPKVRNAVPRKRGKARKQQSRHCRIPKSEKCGAENARKRINSARTGTVKYQKVRNAVPRKHGKA